MYYRFATIKYLKDWYHKWSLIRILWFNDVPTIFKIILTPIAAILMPLAWVIGTMYLLLYHLVYVTVLVPLAWSIWLIRKTFKRKRYKTTYKF